MNSRLFQQQDSPSSDEIEVHALYQQLSDSWNKRNADAFAASFALDGDLVGFDGSQMTGRAEIAVKRDGTRHIALFQKHPSSVSRKTRAGPATDGGATAVARISLPQGRTDEEMRLMHLDDEHDRVLFV